MPKQVVAKKSAPGMDSKRSQKRLPLSTLSQSSANTRSTRCAKSTSTKSTAADPTTASHPAAKSTAATSTKSSADPPQVSARPPPEDYSYIVFVDDPKSQTPFNVLLGSKITDIEKRIYYSRNYLNNERRKRQNDIAFTDQFEQPCRVFAKSPVGNLVRLHKICDNLNRQWKTLTKCKVPVETAYAQLIDQNPRKIKNGIEYETGKVIDESTQENRPPDTSTSYSDVDLFEDNNSEIVKYLK